jgi:hypothetical protein
MDFDPPFIEGLCLMKKATMGFLMWRLIKNGKTKRNTPYRRVEKTTSWTDAWKLLFKAPPLESRRLAESCREL